MREMSEELWSLESLGLHRELVRGADDPRRLQRHRPAALALGAGVLDGRGIPRRRI